MDELKGKKIIIVTDTVLDYGGAEKVLEDLLKIFPSADLYSLLITKNRKEKLLNSNACLKIKTSLFDNLPDNFKNSKYLSIIKFFSWIYWEILDIKEYDIVISSSHSYMSKNVKKKIGAFHLSYMHTPPRYLYDEYNEIDFLKKFPINILIKPCVLFLRYIDKRGSLRPDVLVANSKNVQNRIKKYYNRDSIVVYPSVEISEPKTVDKNKDYYICLSRLVKQKGMDLVISCFNKIDKKLIIIGNGSEYGKLKKLSGKNIKILRNVNDKDKSIYLKNAKAIIYPSINEDFGIVPIEALKLGVPVIAYESGGVIEFVVDKKNGLFFKERNEESLTNVINVFEKSKIDSNFCKESVSKISFLNFKKTIINLLYTR